MWLVDAHFWESGLHLAVTIHPDPIPPCIPPGGPGSRPDAGSGLVQSPMTSFLDPSQSTKSTKTLSIHICTCVKY